MIFKRILNKTKGVFAQSQGLGYLQLYNFIKVLSLVLIAIIFAKYIPSPHLINTWETFMLMGTSVTFFYVSGLGYTLVSFVKNYKQEVWADIFRTCFQLLCFLGIISLFGFIFIGLFISHNAYPLTELLAFGIYLLGTVCSTIVEYIYFLNRSYKKLIVWGLLNFLIVIGCITAPLILGKSIGFALNTLAIFGLAKFIFTLLLIKKPFNFYQNTFFKPLIRHNWPIISSLILGTGYIYLASFILKTQVSDTDFNIFRYGSREFPLFLVMANALSVVIGGLSAEKYNDPDYWDQLKKSQHRILHQLMPLACFFMVCSPYFFEHIFSKAFIPSYAIFNILTLTVLARVLFPQSILLGLGKNKFALYSSVVEFVLGILLVLLLLPYYGIKGVAIGLTLAYFIEKSVLIFFCYTQKIPFHKSLSLSWYLFYTVLLLLCFCYSLMAH